MSGLGKGKTGALIITAIVGLMMGAFGVLRGDMVLVIMGTVIVSLAIMNALVDHFRKPTPIIKR